MTITDLLFGEHGVFYAMFNHIEERLEEASLDEIQILTAILTSSLESHAQLEDDALFKVLEPHIGVMGPIGVMRMEHDEIVKSLVAILQQTDRDAAAKLMRHAIEVARSHFSKEENILFPMAVNVLGEDELASLTSRWTALRLSGAQACSC